MLPRQTVGRAGARRQAVRTPVAGGWSASASPTCSTSARPVGIRCRSLIARGCWSGKLRKVCGTN